MKSKELYCYLAKMELIFFKVNDKVKEKTNLTGLETKLLAMISESGNSCSASELAKLNRVTIAAIMHCLSQLETKGFLVKTINEDDNRMKIYHLTESGESMAVYVRNTYQEKLNTYLDYLGEDRDSLKRIMEKTIKFMEDDLDD